MPVLRTSERAAATVDVLNAWSAMIRRTDKGPSAIDNDLIDCRLVPAVIRFLRLTGGHVVYSGSKCTTPRGGIIRHLSNALTRLPTITSEQPLAQRAEELASATARRRQRRAGRRLAAKG